MGFHQPPCTCVCVHISLFAVIQSIGGHILISISWKRMFAERLPRLQAGWPPIVSCGHGPLRPQPHRREVVCATLVSSCLRGWPLSNVVDIRVHLFQSVFNIVPLAKPESLTAGGILIQLFSRLQQMEDLKPRVFQEVLPPLLKRHFGLIGEACPGWHAVCFWAL